MQRPRHRIVPGWVRVSVRTHMNRDRSTLTVSPLSGDYSTFKGTIFLWRNEKMSVAKSTVQIVFSLFLFTSLYIIIFKSLCTENIFPLFLRTFLEATGKAARLGTSRIYIAAGQPAADTLGRTATPPYSAHLVLLPMHILTGRLFPYHFNSFESSPARRLQPLSDSPVFPNARQEHPAVYPVSSCQRRPIT